MREGRRKERKEEESKGFLAFLIGQAMRVMNLSSADPSILAKFPEEKDECPRLSVSGIAFPPGISSPRDMYMYAHADNERNASSLVFSSLPLHPPRLSPSSFQFR